MTPSTTIQRAEAQSEIGMQDSSLADRWICPLGHSFGWHPVKQTIEMYLVEKTPNQSSAIPSTQASAAQSEEEPKGLSQVTVGQVLIQGL
jgi:hypothetical protein